MAKEINELKNRLNNLEDCSQAQPAGIQSPPINIPLRLDVAEHVIPTGQGIGAATKNISMTKRKKTKELPGIHYSYNSPYKGYHFPKKEIHLIVSTLINYTGKTKSIYRATQIYHAGS